MQCITRRSRCIKNKNVSLKAAAIQAARKEWYDPAVFSSERVKHPPRTVRQAKPKNPDGLICSKCYEGFSDRASLDQHEQNCFLGRCYPCPWPGCNHINSQKSLMQQHYRSVHLKKPFICRSCSKVCTYKKTRDKHEKEVHGKVYEHPSDNEDLGDIDGNTDQSSHQSKPAKVKRELVTFKYNCETCSFATDDKTAFAAHVASHIDVKPFSCSFCQKSFVKQSGLTRHISICDLAQQQLAPGKMPSNSDTAPQTQAQPPPPLFECSVTMCGKVFSLQDKYREHFKSMHVDPLHALGEEIHYCEACIVRLFTKAGFMAHMGFNHDHDG